LEAARLGTPAHRESGRYDVVVSKRAALGATMFYPAHPVADMGRVAQGHAISSRAVSVMRQSKPLGAGPAAAIDQESADMPDPHAAAAPEIAATLVGFAPRVRPDDPGTEPSAMPAWQRFAVASTDDFAHPAIAIMIDDVGLNRRNAKRAIELPGPIT